MTLNLKARFHRFVRKSDGVIVDGHNRYRILQKHPEIQFTTYEKKFTDRYAAIAWICKNQLGRRNLTPQQFKYLIGLQYEAEKCSSNYNGNRFTSLDKSRCVQNEHTYKPERTAERIARENNLSGSYVRRAEHFAKGVDAAEKVVPGIKQEILTGSIKPTEKAVAAIAKAPPEERPALVQQLRQTKEPEKPEKKPQDKEKPEEKPKETTEEKPQEKPKRKRSVAETLQAIRDISENMLQSNGEIDADDICYELEDALDNMIFRWDTCLENNKELRSACRDGIRRLTDKGIQYLKEMRRTT